MNEISRLITIFFPILDAFSTDTPYSQVYSIYGFRRHELYNSTTNANDIAYVYTNVRMAYNIGVGPICLPVQGYV